MITCSDLRTGMTIEHENNLYSVLEYQHVKSARSGAFVRLKFRNLRSGNVVEMTVDSAQKFKPAHIEKNTMQYLYNSGNFYVFMNNESYEQTEIPADSLTSEAKYLYEGLEVKVITYEEEVLGIELPDKVNLTIVECEPGIKGDTATNATKTAVVQTGHTIQVPLFIENGEQIIVSTIDGKYSGRSR
ncbi:MAG: elongation factor [Haloplasmataceae bacterium]|jgi:elongation factor P|nr:elongation factor [Haloplasmataceae bacterium]